MASLPFTARKSNVRNSTGSCPSHTSEGSVVPKFVDLNGDPFVPDRWRDIKRVTHLTMGEKMLWSSTNIDTYRADEQMKGDGVLGSRLARLLNRASLALHNANLIDWWLANQAHFPASLRVDGRYYYAWGTRLFLKENVQVVRCVYYYMGGLREAGGYVGENKWTSSDYALVYDPALLVPASGETAEA